MNIPEFEQFAHGHGAFTHLVFVRGEGPPILLMHELPGLTVACVAFANRMVERGFKVYMPLFFGQPNKQPNGLKIAGKFFRICISREFLVFSQHKTSPVVEWLRSLSRRIHRENEGASMGAIGMCMTGGFAIPLLVEPFMMAPALSQPALPGCITTSCKRSLGVSPEDFAIAKQRVENGVPVYGFRFSNDSMAPQERFDRLAEDFGSQFHPTVIDSSKGNPHGIKSSAHSVFTDDYDDTPGHPTREAFEILMRFFEERLRG